MAQCQSWSNACTSTTESGVDLTGYGRVPCCPPCAEAIGMDPHPLEPARVVDGLADVMHATCARTSVAFDRSVVLRLASQVEVDDAVTCHACGLDLAEPPVA